MEITLDKWDIALDSQAKAFLVGVREATPRMSQGGRIVAITYAPGGRFGSWQPWIAMRAAKAAMEVLVRYFAVALAGRGITVNTISPGSLEDSVLNSLPEAFQVGVREWQERGWTPMGRLGTPSDIGNAVAMICSEEAGWITSQLIDVDGGGSLVNAHLPLELQVIAKPRKTEAAYAVGVDLFEQGYQVSRSSQSCSQMPIFALISIRGRVVMKTGFSKYARAYWYQNSREHLRSAPSFSSSLLPLPLCTRPPGAKHRLRRRPAARIA